MMTVYQGMVGSARSRFGAECSVAECSVEGPNRVGQAHPSEHYSVFRYISAFRCVSAFFLQRLAGHVGHVGDHGIGAHGGELDDLAGIVDGPHVDLEPGGVGGADEVRAG